VESSNLVGVGRRIKKEREARRLTIDAVAKVAAVPEALVEYLERGELVGVTLETLEAVAGVLEVPLLELLTDRGSDRTADQAQADREREAAAFLASLPTSLRTFVEEERAAGRTIADDAVKALAGIEFQHSAPAVPATWREMFEAMLHGLHPT
jgi:transcriptional regulator with XRE-family HTH domain